MSDDAAVTGEVGNWDATLSEAALQLLVGPGDAAERLRAVGERLARLQQEESAEPWAAEALATVQQIVGQALSGAIAVDGALQRVAVLVEMLMLNEQPAASPTPPASPTLMPAEAARTLFPEFVEESLDYLAQAEAALLELESNGAASEPVNVVFRAFHSIKSSAAFLGLDPISHLAHDAESLLAPVRDGKVQLDRVHADLMLGSADLIREMLALARCCAEQGTPLAPPATLAPLQDRLAAAIQRDQAGPAAAPVIVEAAPQPVDSAPADHDNGRGHTLSEGWTRVRTQRLDLLLDLMGELVVAQSMVAHDDVTARERHGAHARKVQHTSKLVRELQELALSLRMVPMRPLFQRLQRLVRDLAAHSGKDIEFVAEGEETEIDRTMVDALTDPLVHMVRNAVDHGIESAEERIAAGKPARGKVRLVAEHAGGTVVVSLEDDGRGLDRARIRAKAVQRGVIAERQALSDAEIDELIFAPGLSTTDNVTELSGRGVGMDVVRRNIEALRGRIDIASTSGGGTTFTLRLPLTLAVTDGMLVRVGGERYIVPTFSIITSFRPTADALITEAQGGELVLVHGRALPLVRLHRVFGIADGRTDPTSALLVVIADAQQRYALMVDELLGQQQFVAKPVAGSLAEVDGVAGAAVLGDGCAGLILDPAGLFAVARAVAPLRASA